MNIFILFTSYKIGKKIVNNNKGIIYSKVINDSIKNNKPIKYVNIILDLAYWTKKNKEIDQNNMLAKYWVNMYGPAKTELAKKGKGEINKNI